MLSGPVNAPTARTPAVTPPPVATPTGPSLKELYAKGSELFLQGSFKEAVAVASA